ncbi:HAD family phosphatase [Clostridioides difficile]|uniref:HAD family hydrolase n=1 Tax=Clostridioides difficile TaxID=1496 RepID=UPI0003B29A55|nr:HAD family phosphatase [Clostridioides difficile]EGT4547883.1 HAD family phosphatase [Clostridioides difficile]EGT4615275.1 HAD family phosphatase [Clostridioides difficile]EGT4733053.1 HAD family phosphatase [Clostridioides difficile]EGT4782053.1 HAD family phosphatase [Clostridioides difficile]EGT5366243.1 HAD family phosphatase [Clostridioides difficile]
MYFEVAIFDLDGTLLDSMYAWERINNSFLEKRNLVVPDSYMNDICHRSLIEAAQYTIDLFNLNEAVEDIIEEWNESALVEYSNNVKIFEPAMEYIIKLKSMGVKLAIATGLSKELYFPCLKNNNVLELFDVLCSTDEVSYRKEHPDIFRLVSVKTGVDPEKCIVFDDILPAIKSAKKIGMQVCGVYDKYSEKNQNEIKSIADMYILDFNSAPLPYKGV